MAADYSHWYNEAGEPMQDGASMRYEMQLDMEYEDEARWSDDLYAGTHYDPSEYEDDVEPLDNDFGEDD